MMPGDDASQLPDESKVPHRSYGGSLTPSDESRQLTKSSTESTRRESEEREVRETAAGRYEKTTTRSETVETKTTSSESFAPQGGAAPALSRAVEQQSRAVSARWHEAMPPQVKLETIGAMNAGTNEPSMLDADFIMAEVERSASRCRWQVEFRSPDALHRASLEATPNADGTLALRAKLEGRVEGPAWSNPSVRDFTGPVQLTFDAAAGVTPSAGVDWPQTVPLTPFFEPVPKEGHYISPEPLAAQMAMMGAGSSFSSSGSPCTIDGVSLQIDADTNRDGKVENEPQNRKNEFNSTYGAICLVNYNLDLTPDSMPPPPPPHQNNANTVVQNDADASKLAKLVVTRKGANALPNGAVVKLTLQNPPGTPASPSPQHRIRIFYKSSAAHPNTYVWILGEGRRGSFSGFGPPPDPITEYTFKQAPDPGEPDLYSAGDRTYELWVEGCEPGMDVNIVLTATFDETTCTDLVRIMPAPFILLSIARNVQTAFVEKRDPPPPGNPPDTDINVELRSRMNDLLPGNVKEYQIFNAAGQQVKDAWCRDQWQFGTASWPAPDNGTPFSMPSGMYLLREEFVGQVNPLRDITGADLMGEIPDPGTPALHSGWYGNYWYAAGALFLSANYGGNLDVSPPITTIAGHPGYPLGRIVCGSDMQDLQKDFLKRQRIQARKEGNEWKLVELNTRWLRLKHIDEFMAFVRATDAADGFKVAQASPRQAQALLGPTVADDSDPKNWRTFFYKPADATEEHGKTTAASGTFAFMGDTFGTLVDDTKDFHALMNAAADERYQYLRVYTGTGKGQVAKIHRDATLATPDTKTLVIERSWYLPDAEAIRKVVYAEAGIPVTEKLWGMSRVPSADSHYVLVHDSQERRRGQTTDYFPAVITAKEIREDNRLWARNDNFDTIIRSEMTWLQFPENLNALHFLEVPVFYFSRTPTAPQDFDALAMSPNPVNLFSLNDHVIIPRAYGPRWGTGGEVDVFTAKAREVLHDPAKGRQCTSDDVVDDWDLYHRNAGEIHCGTNTYRIPIGNEIEWWKKWED